MPTPHHNHCHLAACKARPHTNIPTKHTLWPKYGTKHNMGIRPHTPEFWRMLQHAYLCPIQLVFDKACAPCSVKKKLQLIFCYKKAIRLHCTFWGTFSRVLCSFWTRRLMLETRYGTKLRYPPYQRGAVSNTGMRTNWLCVVTPCHNINTYHHECIQAQSRTLVI